VRTVAPVFPTLGRRGYSIMAAMPSTKLSKVGTKMNRLTGVREIMKDIARALKADPSKQWLNLSPGNPLVIPELESMWRSIARNIVESSEFGSIIGRYGMTQGYEPFIDAVVETYNRLYDWGITRENVLITPGTQSLYFLCTNLFAGEMTEGQKPKQVVVPMVPDYTGYDGVVLDSRSLVSFQAKRTFLGKHEFKYHIDFDAIRVDAQTGAILCSRPCNPTGNVLTEQEVMRLLGYAKQFDIPLIIDSAYAPPFPNLAFTEMRPIFDEHILHCISLSKAGLPGERVGIAIGHKRYIEVLEPFFSNVGIHSSRFGQALAAKAMLSKQLEDVSAQVVRPLYQKKLELFKQALTQFLPDHIAWYLHRAEGSLFAWLWVETEEMNDFEMYQKLKSRGVLCVPGSTFFPGSQGEVPHQHRCMRFSMTAPDEHIEMAAQLLGQELSSHHNLVG
jgi:valine--pyruvate aminotransferase